MAVSNSYREYVMEQLAGLGPVESRMMFGGVGIYLGDLFFALISQNTLFFKVDDESRPDYEKYDMKPFKPFEDKPGVMQYFEVPVDILEDREMILEWARKAIEVATSARLKK